MTKFFESTFSIPDFITGNRFIDICDNTNATFCKTDFIFDYRNKSEKVFVTHNSDYSINKGFVDAGPEYKYWFAQNKDFDDKSIVSIPIGLENMFLRSTDGAQGGRFSSEVKGAAYKGSLIDKYSSFNMPKHGLAYLNFNIETYPKERKKVWDIFKNSSWTTATEKLSVEKYYFDLASHKFAFSPRGNGIDCHRTWEALYMKTIPIVKRTLAMEEFSDLPIYFVNDWSEITEDSLNKFYEKVQKSEFNLEKMKIGYWRERISSALGE